MKQAIWKGYSNMVVRLYKHLKSLLKNPEIKAIFPVNLKTITIEHLNYLMINKPNNFQKLFEKFKKNQANYTEATVLEKKKEYLGKNKKKFQFLQTASEDSLEKEKINQLKFNFARNKVSLDISNLPFNVCRSYQIRSMFTGENIKVCS